MSSWGAVDCITPKRHTDRKDRGHRTGNQTDRWNTYTYSFCTVTLEKWGLLLHWQDSSGNVWKIIFYLIVLNKFFIAFISNNSKKFGFMVVENPKWIFVANNSFTSDQQKRKRKN